MDLEKVGCEDGGQMELAEDRVQCQGLVLAVMGLHVLLRADDRIWGPPNFLACGYPGIKQPESEAYHSPLCSAEAKNAWRCTSTPKYVFMAWCLVKHRDNFTFTLVYLRTLFQLHGIYSVEWE